MSSPSSTTLSAGPALMVIPFVPDTSTPASTWSERMVIDLVMVTPPNPPGSRTLISPAAAVLEMAPANVLHGAVRLHGLASSPTPDTQVRVACAFAEPAADTISMSARPSMLAHAVKKRMSPSPQCCQPAMQTPGRPLRPSYNLTAIRNFLFKRVGYSSKRHVFYIISCLYLS